MILPKRLLGALIEVFTKAGLDFVDLMVSMISCGGESIVIEKDMRKCQPAASLVDEAWDNLSADRNPNFATSRA